MASADSSERASFTMAGRIKKRASQCPKLDELRPEIESLLYLRRMTTAQIQKEINTRFGLSATYSQYRDRLSKWGYRRNLTDKEWKFVDKCVKSRSGKDSQVLLDGHLVVSEKKVKRGLRRIGQQMTYTERVFYEAQRSREDEVRLPTRLATPTQQDECGPEAVVVSTPPPLDMIVGQSRYSPRLFTTAGLPIHYACNQLGTQFRQAFGKVQDLDDTFIVSTKRAPQHYILFCLVIYQTSNNVIRYHALGRLLDCLQELQYWGPFTQSLLSSSPSILSSCRPILPLLVLRGHTEVASEIYRLDARLRRDIYRDLGRGWMIHQDLQQRQGALGKRYSLVSYMNRLLSIIFNRGLHPTSAKEACLGLLACKIANVPVAKLFQLWNNGGPTAEEIEEVIPNPSYIFTTLFDSKLEDLCAYLDYGFVTPCYYLLLVAVIRRESQTIKTTFQYASTHPRLNRHLAELLSHKDLSSNPINGVFRYPVFDLILEKTLFTMDADGEVPQLQKSKDFWKIEKAGLLLFLVSCSRQGTAFVTSFLQDWHFPRCSSISFESGLIRALDACKEFTDQFGAVSGRCNELWGGRNPFEFDSYVWSGIDHFNASTLTWLFDSMIPIANDSRAFSTEILWYYLQNTFGGSGCIPHEILGSLSASQILSTDSQVLDPEPDMDFISRLISHGADLVPSQHGSPGCSKQHKSHLIQLAFLSKTPALFTLLLPLTDDSTFWLLSLFDGHDISVSGQFFHALEDDKENEDMDPAKWSELWPRRVTSTPPPELLENILNLILTGNDYATAGEFLAVLPDIDPTLIVLVLLLRDLMRQVIGTQNDHLVLTESYLKTRTTRSQGNPSFIDREEYRSLQAIFSELFRFCCDNDRSDLLTPLFQHSTAIYDLAKSINLDDLSDLLMGMELFRGVPTHVIQHKSGKNLKCLRVLVEKFGFDVNHPPQEDGYGITLLISAIRAGNMNAVVYLLDQGAKIDISGTGLGQGTAIDWVVKKGRLDMMALFLRTDPECRELALEAARHHGNSLMEDLIISFQEIDLTTSLSDSVSPDGFFDFAGCSGHLHHHHPSPGSGVALPTLRLRS